MGFFSGMAAILSVLDKSAEIKLRITPEVTDQPGANGMCDKSDYRLTGPLTSYNNPWRWHLLS
jgi:hypothetical protein